MRNFVALVFCTLTLFGCSNPKDTIVPTQLSKMDEIKPAIQKLTDDEKELFAGYVMRHTVGAALGGAFGIKAEPIPDGMTIGKAIAEQKEFKANAVAKEATEKEIKARVEAERKAKQEEFAKLVSVVVVGKKNDLEKYDQRFVSFRIAFENKSDKDIAGVKGTLKVMDMFGDKILNINWGFDQGVKAHETSVEAGSGVKINEFIDDHMRLWNTDYEKLKFAFVVLKVVFADGTTMDAPE